tara:strand:- start:391 stop:672 length:282 start_codon:yes stop_codon:yes gene_type:complete
MCVEWTKKGRIVFSFAQRGKAIAGHFAADKKGLRHIKEAINDFCEWAFYTFEWCRMMLAMIQKPSVERIVRKCGFVFLGESTKAKIYMRCKDG